MTHYRSKNCEHGKIYMLRSPETDMIYIGSTTSPSISKKWEYYMKYKDVNNSTSNEILKYDNAYIQILRVFPCSHRDELECMEGYYQDKYKDICVNKNRAGKNFEMPIIIPTPRISRYDTTGPFRLPYPPS